MVIFKCPCCENTLYYRNYRETHAWICDTCPIVMFEYYDDNNLRDLKEIIHNNPSVNNFLKK